MGRFGGAAPRPSLDVDQAVTGTLSFEDHRGTVVALDMSITVGQRQSYSETKREEEERLQLERRHEAECNTFREVMGLRPAEAMEPKFADPADASDASWAASKKLLQGQLRQFTASGNDDAKFVSSIAFCARMLGEEPPSAKALTRAARSPPTAAGAGRHRCPRDGSEDAELRRQPNLGRIGGADRRPH